MPPMISTPDIKNILSQLDSHTIRSIAVKLAWAALALGALTLTGKLLGHYIPEAERWIEQQGAWAPITYLLIYTLFVSCFVSVDALSFIAGVIFGLGPGFLYAYAGTFLSGTLIFFIGRHLAHDRVKQFVQRHPKLSNMENSAHQHGLKIMFLLRLTPLPFAPLSYALSTTETSFLPYLIACSGMFLTNFVSVFCGFTAQHMGQLAGGQEHLPGLRYACMFAILLVSIALAAIIARMAHKTIAEIRKT